MKWLKRGAKKYSDGFLQLTKGLPQLPSKTQKKLAGLVPWLLACFSFSAFWTAWQLWQESRPLEPISNVGGALGQALKTPITLETTAIYWLELCILVLLGVCFAVSFVMMQNRLSTGWRLGLVSCTLILLIYALVVSSTTTTTGPEVPAILTTSLTLAYLLTQVRTYFPEKIKPRSKKSKKIS